MAPLICLVTVTTLALLAQTALHHWRHRGPFSPERRRAARERALRTGVTAMFAMTGVAHFVGLRDELIAMVPPQLPVPALLVTLTGVLELLGAAGLWVARTRFAAAACLTVLLVALFPANVHHALTGAALPWDDQLLPRGLMQVVFLVATGTLLQWNRPRDRGDAPAAVRPEAGLRR